LSETVKPPGDLEPPNSRASGHSGHSRGRWLAQIFVIFAGAVAYSNSFHGPFIFDDAISIAKNPQIYSLNPFKYPSLGPSAVAGRPALIFTLALDYAIGGLHVEIYHATNLLIHLLAALTLYGVVRRTLLRTGVCGNRQVESATWLAGMVAILWAVHPLDTQAVTYIAQRSESLASLFFLLSIYCVIRAADGPKGWGVAAVIACGLGMASKEIVAVAPILIMLYDRTFLAGTFKSALARRWKIYAGMAAMWIFILFSLHTGEREIMVGSHLGVSPIEYLRTELNVIARYLRLAFWPTDLVLDYYDWPIARHWSDVQWQGWLVLGLAAATLIALRWWPRLGFLGASFFLILAPTSSILPIKQEAAAEQRMYLPLAAVVCLVVVGGWAILCRRRALRWAAGIAGCLVILLLVRLTMERNELYSNPVDIWTDTVTKRPQNTRAHVNLGEAWAQTSVEFPAGSPEAIGAARNAAQQFRIVLALEPRVNHAVFALGQSLERMNEPLAAENLYTQALPKYPEVAGDLLVERGNLRARRHDWTDAKADFLAAIQANPANVEPHYFLGVLYQQLGDWNPAEVELAKTVAISPKYKDAVARLDEVRQSAAAPKR
jgi:protein O-mannosyl-transferase